MTEVERRSLENLRGAVTAAQSTLVAAQLRLLGRNPSQPPLPDLPADVRLALGHAVSDLDQALGVLAELILAAQLAELRAAGRVSNGLHTTPG